MPISRSPQIAPLSRDHHHALVFALRLNKGVAKKAEPETIRQYCRWFWDEHQASHFHAEEELLFIHKVEGTQQALAEHEAIRSWMKGLQSAGYPEFKWLADAVNAHVKFEEKELFPRYERELPVDRIATIGLELQRREALEQPACYPQPFWK